MADVSMYQKIIHKFHQNKLELVLFIIGGIGSYGINLVLPWILTEGFGIWYVYSITITQIIQFIYAFTYNMLLTFRADFHWLRLVRYTVVLVIALLTNILLSYLLTDFVGLYYMVSIAISIIVIFSFKYIAYKKWVFKKN
jgi:dolichol-phosphate mannosyltransferase